ncbi:MAG: hypothetical protein IPL35_00145 [Sphingobacteriales bacterium]|nr:hypothetical protein [Sphingobacteriales bacterium]
MGKYLILILCGTLLLFTLSCTKTEIAVVGDNNAPEDYTISNEIKDNFISKTFCCSWAENPAT